ncbi:sugar phosphate isomerase/epimerase family protein [Youxingia wuxianensis]|uniref:Sugar phosphate isomerase/epimerase n=1 Tax=Youxingia wuxianensis TaxID=2763678 RepID=A0A926IJ73_9FIRM|nr:sugar phosphate isomerase/epimerase family protein [Youxingia wuxianensis]MBC8586393.1 sugar phosphate isomerase/epimerase [Youxingia wuxianensis]
MSKITMDNMSVMSVCYTRYSLEYTMESIAGAGLKQFEFYAGSPHYTSFDYPDPKEKAARLDYIVKLLQKNNLKLSCLTAENCIYPINIAAKEDELREISVQHYLDYVDDAVTLGSPALFMCSGFGYYNEPAEPAFQRSMESIKRICEKAEKKGICLFLEQLAPDESNLVYDLKTLKKMIDQVNSPALKICVDTVAMEVQKETIEEYYRIFPDKIAHVHMQDGTPQGHLVAGEGNADFKKYLDTLRKYDFKGAITTEINNDIYLRDPDAALRKALAYLRPLLDD